MSRGTYVWDPVKQQVVEKSKRTVVEAKRLAPIKLRRRIRGRWIWDPQRRELVDVSKYERQPSAGAGLQVVRDIEPYRAVASDVAAGGQRPVISGRRQHREFLKRNGYVEHGNEMPKRQLPRHDREGVRQALRKAYDTGMTPEARHAAERANSVFKER
jgi:hypothetical protein